jgi:hypothetical protein
MSDKIIQQADQAVTKVNRALSLFERDLEKLRIEHDKIVASLEERLKLALINHEAQIETVLKKGREEIAELVFVVPKSIEEQRKNLDAFIDTRTREFMDDAFDMFKKGLEEKRVQSNIEIDTMFQKDIEGIFKKYEGKLAPMLFKMLRRYIFRFGRKLES